jgi:hypothetical protein
MTESFRNALGLYFSIPFCKAKCTYCNFASGVYPASEHERYVDRLIADLAGSRGWAESMQVEAPRLVDTVYFGGGTPVLLAPELFTRIFAAIREQFDVTADAVRAGAVAGCDFGGDGGGWGEPGFAGRAVVCGSRGEFERAVPYKGDCA